jgi:hypothetical protein
MREFFAGLRPWQRDVAADVAEVVVDNGDFTVVSDVVVNSEVTVVSDGDTVFVFAGGEARVRATLERAFEARVRAVCAGELAE